MGYQIKFIFEKFSLTLRHSRASEFLKIMNDWIHWASNSTVKQYQCWFGFSVLSALAFIRSGTVLHTSHMYTHSRAQVWV